VQELNYRNDDLNDCNFRLEKVVETKDAAMAKALDGNQAKTVKLAEISQKLKQEKMENVRIASETSELKSKLAAVAKESALECKTKADMANLSKRLRNKESELAKCRFEWGNSLERIFALEREVTRATESFDATEAEKDELITQVGQALNARDKRNEDARKLAEERRELIATIKSLKFTHDRELKKVRDEAKKVEGYFAVILTIRHLKRKLAGAR
jgi:chromosome segregation ATPase